MTLPATWADKTWPCGDMSKLTDSKTSKNNSFLLYFIPSRRHPIWPVTCDVIWACSSLVWDFTPCWVMNVFKAPTWRICYLKSYSSYSSYTNLSVLWIAKIQNFIKQLINKNKIIFNIFFRNLCKITLHNIDNTI